MPHTGIQYGQPSSVVGPAAFRFAASACVVMPVAAQTTTAIATIRAIVICPPMVGPVSGRFTNKTGGIDVAQLKTTRKQTAQIDGCCARCEPHVRFGSTADICAATSDVRFTPESRHVLCNEQCPLWANSGHYTSFYSITSSAAGEECGRHGEAKHLGSLAVKNQFELCGLLDWWRRDAHDAWTI
jgi:hypothetical protein